MTNRHDQATALVIGVPVALVLVVFSVGCFAFSGGWPVFLPLALSALCVLGLYSEGELQARRGPVKRLR